MIVSISVAIDHNSYGTEQSCWLNTENYFVLSFVGPAFVVILVINQSMNFVTNQQPLTNDHFRLI